jgi:DNA-binding HxlR family transcriptional regulator
LEDGKEFEQDRERAEIFDALGHPTRIAILKALSEGPVGFSELKKKTSIESSGHLQHHLNKLNSLIKTDDYGKYCLTDQGKDALLTVQTVESVASSNGKKVANKSSIKRFETKSISKIVAIGLAVLLLASIAINVYGFIQAQNFQNQISQRDLAIGQQQILSQIQVVNIAPSVGPSFVFHTILVGNDTSNLKLYTLSASIVVQIRNPTPYNVTLQLQGELNVTLSGQESGNRAWNESRFFSVPMNSDNVYDLSFYRGGEYADQTAVSATINNCEVYILSGHISRE